MAQEFPVFEMQAQLYHVLGNTIRLRIVNALRDGPMCVNELVAVLQTVPQPSVSRHLAVLRSAGVLSTRRHGMEVVYTIASPKILGVCEMMHSILAERESKNFAILNPVQV
jgi:ArsR family transcriptional regulator